jgi:outer membrane murein-binding lipoprotein Lpp
VPVPVPVPVVPESKHESVPEPTKAPEVIPHKYVQVKGGSPMGFLLSIFSGIKTYLIIGAIIAAMAGAALFYFNYSQNKIEQLEKDVATQQAVIGAYKTEVDTMNRQALEAKANQDALNDELQKIRLEKEKETAHNNFPIRGKHEVIRKQVNDATAKALRDLESLSR